MPQAVPGNLSDYNMDAEWREIFGSSIDLTNCMVDILESFNMDVGDIGLPPDVEGGSPGGSPAARKCSPSECEVFSTDSADSGHSTNLDRNSMWRNSSSSSSSHQSSLSLVSETTLDTGGASQLNRHSLLSTGSKTHFIMDEIIQTEKNYLEALRQICTGYLQPMKSSSMFTSVDVINVFNNLEDIYSFHRTFMATLLPPDLCGPAYLAQCFVDHGSDFEIYTDYCTNYATSVNHLAYLMKEQPDWFKDRRLELNHVLQLGPYLLKPIQRILKYHLLLQKLLDNCDCDAAGYGTVQLALETMKNMAQKINEVQHQKERKIRFEDLQLMLVELPANLSLQEFGELLLEDVFRITGAKGERNLFLFEMGLLIVKRRDQDGTFLFKNYISHANLMLSEVIQESSLHFSVIPFDNPKILTVIEARNMEQKRLWTSRLKELMLKHFGRNIPEHVRQLVMQLGEVPRGDSDNAPRRFRPQIFNTPAAPDYLQKRRAKSPLRENLVKNAELRQPRQERRRTAPLIDFEGFNASKDEDRDANVPPKPSHAKKQHRAARKDKPKTTAVFHVSTDYIPRTKEDEFLYEETFVKSSNNPDNSDRRQSTTSLQESVTTPKKQLLRKTSSDDSVEPELRSADSTNNLSTAIFKVPNGLKSAFGKAFHSVFGPIRKTFDAEEFLQCEEVELCDDEPDDMTRVETSNPAMCRFPFEQKLGTSRLPSLYIDDSNGESDGFYEKDLEILEQVPGASRTGDGDSAVYSDHEDWKDSSSNSPSLYTHTKLRRTYASVSSDVGVSSEQPNKSGCSIKRKGAIKKRPSMPRTKSAPGTPLVSEKHSVDNCSKQTSSLIQAKIRSLEEKSQWKSDNLINVDQGRPIDQLKKSLLSSATQPIPPADHPMCRSTSPSTLASDLLQRESWVTMMVKKIESGDTKLSSV